VTRATVAGSTLWVALKGGDLVTLRRVALIAVPLVLALVLPFSLVAVASPPTAAPPAPQPTPIPDPPTITASGTASFPGTSPSDVFLMPQTLFIAAQSKSGPADVDAAVAEMQARLQAIRAALEKLGVPTAAIRFQGINVLPQYGPPGPGSPSPVDKGQPLPQQVLSFMISSNLQAEVSDPKLLVPAINAATANGATTVNSSSGKAGPVTTLPPTDQLAKGVADALKNARSIAEATAFASGQKLGPVRSVNAQQIYPSCCPQGSTWQVTITVTFDTVP
jgi:uncharacterized protein YggE